MILKKRENGLLVLVLSVLIIVLIMPGIIAQEEDDLEKTFSEKFMDFVGNFKIAGQLTFSERILENECRSYEASIVGFGELIEIYEEEIIDADETLTEIYLERMNGYQIKLDEVLANYTERCLIENAICIDSDPEQDPFLLGICSDSARDYFDSCTRNQLNVEQFKCHDNVPFCAKILNIGCENGCMEGVCINITDEVNDTISDLDSSVSIDEVNISETEIETNVSGDLDSSVSIDEVDTTEVEIETNVSSDLDLSDFTFEFGEGSGSTEDFLSPVGLAGSIGSSVIGGLLFGSINIPFLGVPFQMFFLGLSSLFGFGSDPPQFGVLIERTSEGFVLVYATGVHGFPEEYGQAVANAVLAGLNAADESGLVQDDLGRTRFTFIIDSSGDFIVSTGNKNYGIGGRREGSSRRVSPNVKPNTISGIIQVFLTTSKVALPRIGFGREGVSSPLGRFQGGVFPLNTTDERVLKAIKYFRRADSLSGRH